MVTTKKTSFPSLHSDQGHGLTKVWSKQEKKQITKLQNKEGLNASKSLGERGWEEGGLLEEGFNSQSVDISPKIIFTPKICSFRHQLLLVAFTHFLSSNPPECQDWGAVPVGQANLGNARILRAFVTATPPLLQQL